MSDNGTRGERDTMKHRALLVTVILGGCSHPAPPAPELPHLELAASFKARAARLGCTPTMVDSPLAFECTKRLQPCGCTLAVRASTTSEENEDGRHLALVKVDLFGCPDSAAAVSEALALIDPILSAATADAFHQFASTPRVRRAASETATFGAFQSATFGHVHARALFGVVTETPRRTIWLDRYSPPNIERLVPDSPAYGACDSATATVSGDGKNTPPARPLGYCERTSSTSPPCDFGQSRNTTRDNLSAQIALARSWWSSAVQSRGIADRIRKSQIQLDGGLGQRVTSTLFDVVGNAAEGATTRGDDEDRGRVLRARQLVEQLVATMPIPTERSSIAAYLESVSYEWADNIRAQIGQLSDRDLAALSDEISAQLGATGVSDFGKKIDASLTRASAR